MTDYRPEQALQVARERGWTLTVLDVDAAYKQHLAEGELWLPFCPACSRFLPAWISRCADHWDAGMEMAQVLGEIRLWSWVEYVRPYALPGGYPNLLAPDATDQIGAAYGPNAARLWMIKQRYDPDGVFAATVVSPFAPA